MLLECRTCPARGDACRDCMVSVLVDGPTVPLDPRERAVVDAFVGAGLVRIDEAHTLRARHDPVAGRAGLPLRVGRAG